MTLKTGLEILAMPGPTNVPEAVLSAMHRPAIDIYAGELLAITDRCLGRLQTVFSTRHRTYINISNGHGGWESALTNTLSAGDEVLVLESGVFAYAWGVAAEKLGLRAHTVPGDIRRPVDPAAVEAALRTPELAGVKAILVVQIDTATGVVNDIPAIRKAIDSVGHGALLMVDTIASLATMPFEMDRWGVDVAVAGSQKGLMLPPGLSFVAAGPRATEAHQRAGLRTSYWDWTGREGEEHYQKYCGTPPEHLLFGLDKALDMLLVEETLPAAIRRHALLADAVRAAVSVWREGQVIDFNVIDEAARSNSVTTVLVTEDLNPESIRDFCLRICGVTIGQGIGMLQGKAFRIAHMGYANAPMVLGTLGSIDLALKTLDIPHGSGALEAANRALSEGLKIAST